MASRTVLLVLLLLTACQGGDRPASPPAASPPAASAGAWPGLDPCSLLTGDEIRAAMGWAPDSTSQRWYGSTGYCDWHGPGTGDKVNLLVGQGMPDMSGSPAMAAWRTQQYQGMSVTDAIVEPLDGLGVPAIRNELAGVVAVEMAIKGQLVTLSAIADPAPIIRLAGFVAGRMK